MIRDIEVKVRCTIDDELIDSGEVSITPGFKCKDYFQNKMEEIFAKEEGYNSTKVNVVDKY